MKKSWNTIKKIITELEVQAERLGYRLTFFRLNFQEVV